MVYNCAKTEHVLTKSSGHQSAARFFSCRENRYTSLFSLAPDLTCSHGQTCSVSDWTSTKTCLYTRWHRCILHKRMCSCIHIHTQGSRSKCKYTLSPNNAFLAHCVLTPAAGQVTYSLLTMWTNHNAQSLSLKRIRELLLKLQVFLIRSNTISCHRTSTVFFRTITTIIACKMMG